MPRLAGIDIPEQKKLFMALQGIYGIGPKLSEEVIVRANVDREKRTRDLTADETNRLQKVLEQYNIEGNLRRVINDNIQRLKRVKAYRGLRHMAGLPARGQRTKTNSRNARGGGKRRTIGAMSKEMAAKLDAAKTAKK
jgi:small subunit ribosomal protein S13